MMFLKACPKCEGDLLLGGDMYGRYVKCLQCGFMKDVAEPKRRITAEPEFVGEHEAA